jgi:ribosomal-protein-alanine N-acetyltransferase
MLHLNFNPFPTLTSERLLLREVVPNDVNEIFFLRSNKTVLKFINMPLATATEQAAQWIERITVAHKNNISINWGISLKEDSKIIGNICFWNISPEKDQAEIGYTLRPEFHGKGIMQETFTKVLEYGFDVMKLRRIEAYTSPHNSRSTALLERNNFIREKVILEEDGSGEKRFENAIYVLEKS